MASVVMDDGGVWWTDDEKKGVCVGLGLGSGARKRERRRRERTNRVCVRVCERPVVARSTCHKV